MTSGGNGPLVPTFHGFVHNSMDGLILFEACLSGKLHHVPRRPHDRERTSLIKSGSIFIYEENASGIKRWTDGVAWSPSRILGNFLIYRELEKPFPPGEKKRAMKRKRSSLPGEEYTRRGPAEPEPEVVRPLTPPTPSVTEPKSAVSNGDPDKELERSLIGSLVDSYGFRPDGLVKKTMSISVSGISHHMVSYYKVEDVKNNLLPRPLSDARLSSITVRPELYLKQNFRAPVEESDHYAIDGQMHAHPQIMYSSMNGNPYGVRPGQYFGGQYPQMYSMPSSGANMYPSGTSTSSWPATPTSAGGLPYNAHPAYPAQNYPNSYYKSEPHSATSVKEEQHPSTPSLNGYGPQYTSSYQNIPREQSHGSNGMIHSSYSTPVQQQAPTFTSMTAPTARPIYSNGVINGNAQVYSNGQANPNISSQQYPVRSPPQQYGMSSAPPSTSAQSPHHNAKSPVSATPSNHAVQPISSMNGEAIHNGHISYRRSTSYGVPHTPQSAGHSAGDMSGLGITSNAGYGYGAGNQAFRAVAEVGGAQGGHHYGQ